MKNIAVHLATGFEETEAITIIDVLRRAGLNVQTVSITGNRLVNGAHKVPVAADLLFEELNYDEIDMIILPGGMPGAKNLDAHKGLKEKILTFHEQQKPLGAICAAPLVFGHLNILENKVAVCYPGFESELKGAKIETTPTAVDGHIITGRGVGAALHFALKISELLIGKEKADHLAKAMLVEDWD
ncbi:DJ-1 family glyoxalase III [Mangrovibacterium lignilyticum]|uniref:DJ-1 family glyoxalase III n=1 Tax=Mangrovibacterium lignilyticum TaxID=2668052 RepID=UPI0013D87D1E|nr:DJ-1 family glyoxalase III [Mangrovibacterium lignilyticum]